MLVASRVPGGWGTSVVQVRISASNVCINPLRLEPQIPVLCENTTILHQNCLKEHLKLAGMQQKYCFKILDKKNTFSLKRVWLFMCHVTQKHSSLLICYRYFYCWAKETSLPPGSNLINVNDKGRKSLQVSTSLGTLPNAQHCHFNDMITAHKMTTKL